MARRDTVSQYSTDTIGIGIYEGNQYADADGDVLISVLREKNSTEDETMVIENEVATSDPGLGLYSFNLTVPITSIKGDYTATWTYSVGGVEKEFKYSFTVVDPQPFFDALKPEQKLMVDNIYHRVSDGFDSTVGGPYLWELPQSSFSYETIARLMTVEAMNLINFSRPKALNLTIQSVPPNWYGLVEKAAAYELYKHLARAYLEIPAPVGVNVAHLDRREYSDKWMRMADYEKQELEIQIRIAKRTMMYGVRTRSSLLAGGIFPVSYLNPARPRWPYVLTRFY